MPGDRKKICNIGQEIVKVDLIAWECTVIARGCVGTFASVEECACMCVWCVCVVWCGVVCVCVCVCVYVCVYVCEGGYVCMCV